MNETLQHQNDLFPEDRVWRLARRQPVTGRPGRLAWDDTLVLIAHLLALRLAQRLVHPKDRPPPPPNSNALLHMTGTPQWVACLDLPPRIRARLDAQRIPLRCGPGIDERRIERPLCFAYELGDLQVLMPAGLGMRVLLDQDLADIAESMGLDPALLLALVLLALDQTADAAKESRQVRILLAQCQGKIPDPDASQVRAWGIEKLRARFVGTPWTLPASPAVDNADESAPVKPGRKSSSTSTATSTPKLGPEMLGWVLCQPEEIEQRKAVIAKDSKHTERVQVLDALAARPIRPLPRTQPRHAQAVADLRPHFPNFAEVLEMIVPHLQLQVRLGIALQLPPLLLLGPPGIGKTHFARRLARALDAMLHFQDLSATTAGFLITGNATSWADSAPGCIARLLARLPDGQHPMVFFDEVDKARTGNFPADQALLKVLESESARQFRDEHLDVHLDAQPISYLLACNRLESIRPELLSRVQVIAVPAPGPEQMPLIVRSVDAELRAEMPPLERVFRPLSEALIAQMPELSPRQLRRFLLTTYTQAGTRTQGQDDGVEVQAADLPRHLKAHCDRPVSPQTWMCRPEVWRLH